MHLYSIVLPDSFLNHYPPVSNHNLYQNYNLDRQCKVNFSEMWSDVEVMKTLKTYLSPSSWSQAYASHNFIIAFEASISSSPSEMHSSCHAKAI